jgi:predicted Zn-dependent protease
MSKPLDSALAAPEAHDVVMDAETEAFLASLGYMGGGAGGSAEGGPHPREMTFMQGELQAAQGAAGKRNWEFLSRFCSDILETDPTNKWALGNLTTALIERGHAREAQDVAAEMIRLYPDNDQSYVLMARTYHAQGQDELAFRTLSQGLARVPHSELLTYLAAVAAFDAQHADVCDRQVPAAVQQFPAAPRMLVLRARCESMEGDQDKTLATLEQAVALGFGRMQLLADAGEFEALKSDPRFQALLEKKDESTVGNSAEEAGL